MKKTGISVITTSHNREQDIEELLSGIYRCLNDDDELIIIDDASTDNTVEIIASVVENAGHERTFFFDNGQRRGRGISLQMALEEVSHDVLWVVDQAYFPDPELLRGSENLLRTTDALSVIMAGFSVPKDVNGWINLLNEGFFPPDTVYLWNRNRIPSEHRFFSPYWSGFQATELALRLSNKGAFVTANSHQIRHNQAVDTQIQRRFLTHLLGSGGLDPSQISGITDLLGKLSAAPAETQDSGDMQRLMAEAERLSAQGNAVAALEKLDYLLLLIPTHSEARRLKVSLLNKLRRYVEAAELKHLLEKEKPSPHTDDFDIDSVDATLSEEAQTNEHTEEIIAETKAAPETETAEPVPDEKYDLSVIIPAVGIAKNHTLKCLDALLTHEEEAKLQILLIDNGCMDDTMEMVAQQFGEAVTLLQNEHNPGFGTTINQALSLVSADVVAVMHNDVLLESDALTQLKNLLLSHPEYGILAPMADASLNPAQMQHDSQIDGNTIIEGEYSDSFCMVFRKNTPARFDEAYGPAYFEDMDFCWQVRTQGLRIGLVPSLRVKHLFGASMRDFGLNPLDEHYWKNSAYFNKKWQMEPAITEEITELEPLEQLLTIGDGINVLFPENDLLAHAQKLFSSEMKTEIDHTHFAAHEIRAMVRLLMAMDQRDLLRKLEEQLDELPLDRETYQLLLIYYYRRNIYSRCKKYIHAIDEQERPFIFRLYEARIAYEERELDLAMDLVATLGKERPSHPDLLVLASCLHTLNENDDQAAHYLAMAERLQPGISNQYS